MTVCLRDAQGPLGHAAPVLEDYESVLFDDGRRLRGQPEAPLVSQQRSVHHHAHVEVARQRRRHAQWRVGLEPHAKRTGDAS